MYESRGALAEVQAVVDNFDALSFEIILRTHSITSGNEALVLSHKTLLSRSYFVVYEVGAWLSWGANRLRGGKQLVKEGEGFALQLDYLIALSTWLMSGRACTQPNPCQANSGRCAP